MDGIECGHRMTSTGLEAFFALKDPATGDASVSPSNQQVPLQHPKSKHIATPNIAA